VKEAKTSAIIGIVTFTCALGVTVLDFLMPTHVPWYGLYAIPVVWMALWSADEDAFSVVVLAILVSLLSLLRGFLSFGNLVPMRIEDRLPLLAVIWSTVLLAVLRKRTRRTFRWINLARRRKY